MKHFVLSVFCCVALMACKKEDTPDITKQEDLITGFTLIDPNGNPVQDVGEPNEQNFTDENIAVSFYPNPSSDLIEVRLLATTTTTVSAWLSYAQFDQSLQYSTYYTVPAGSPGKIALETFNDLELSGNKTLKIDVAGLPAGPYRLYFRSGTQLAWKNVLIKR